MKYEVGQKLICVEDFIMDSEYEDTIEIKKNPEYGKNIAFKKGKVYVIKDIIEYGYYKNVLHSESGDEHQMSNDSLNYYFRDVRENRENKLNRIINNNNNLS